MSCEKGADGPNSGPAAQFIWNSLIKIHTMHHSYWDSLRGMIRAFALSADDMEDTFAPILEPKSNQWINILIDLLTLETLLTAAPNPLQRVPQAAQPRDV